jgi:hypothetical protein
MWTILLILFVNKEIGLFEDKAECMEALIELKKQAHFVAICVEPISNKKRERTRRSLSSVLKQ